MIGTPNARTPKYGISHTKTAAAYPVPNTNDPVSPINIDAGCLLNTKNPKHNPARIENGGIIDACPNK